MSFLKNIRIDNFLHHNKYIVLKTCNLSIDPNAPETFGKVLGQGKYSIVFTSRIPSTLNTSSSENWLLSSQFSNIWFTTNSLSLFQAEVSFLSCKLLSNQNR